MVERRTWLVQCRYVCRPLSVCVRGFRCFPSAKATSPKEGQAQFGIRARDNAYPSASVSITGTVCTLQQRAAPVIGHIDSIDGWADQECRTRHKSCRIPIPGAIIGQMRTLTQIASYDSAFLPPCATSQVCKPPFPQRPEMVVWALSSALLMGSAWALDWVFGVL